MGTKGAFIALVSSAFQFTLLNHGWFFISSEPLAPRRFAGFFYSKPFKILPRFGDTLIGKYVHLAFGYYCG